MKILILSALFPPHAFGGAEDCAASFAEWAATHGHDVTVVMAAKEAREAGTSFRCGNALVLMVQTPHIYPIADFRHAPRWQKPIWHFQDHFSAGISSALDVLLNDFSPDAIVIHYLQGFGYRTLEKLARYGAPVIYVLHDLGLACVRMSMFRNGARCVRQCTLCQYSSRYKERLVKAASRKMAIGFVSPSRANLETLAAFFPVGAFPNAVILNTKSYPPPKVAHLHSGTIRLLFAGKLDLAKGIHILAEAVARLADKAAISLSIAGAGPLETQLRERYGDKAWCRFLGFLSQQQLADEMELSDVLCVPSLWQENSPGVAIQALSIGLPVVASDRGGMPELITDGVTGQLVAEDTVEAWEAALRRLVEAPEIAAAWRAQATERRTDFDENENGAKMIGFIEKLLSEGRDRKPIIAASERSIAAGEGNRR